MPNDKTEVGQHWLRQWLVAWQHQAIACINVDLSSVKSSNNRLRLISQNITQPSVTKTSFKITYHSNFPGVKELIHWSLNTIQGITSVVADGLVPIWHQNICNHHDDLGKSTYVGSALCINTRYQTPTDQHQLDINLILSSWMDV